MKSMSSYNFRHRPRGGKALALVCLLGAFHRDSFAYPAGEAVRILMDSAPATLNPRATLDAAGQRLNALVFASLTRIRPDLEPEPDLAASWRVADGGRTWVFKMREDARDHGGEPITAARMAACLEQYRAGKPVSPLRGSLPKWIQTESTDKEVTLKLSGPDPYLARNISLFRYFRTAKGPCVDPVEGAAPIASGRYRYAEWEATPERELALIPVQPGLTPMRILFVRDENTKAIRLIRGEVDAIQNGISLSKTDWLRKKYGDRFRIVDRDGVAVSYLAFNVRDPLLAKKEIRRAIALAIDREAIVKGKLAGFSTVAGSLLSPILPESRQIEFPADRAESIRLLEAAGYRPDAHGVRLTVHYKSTPVREGIETALIIQDMLARVGIRLVVDVVEPAVFISSVRKGAYQLYSSRWLGVADGSILYSTLHTGQTLNRAGYSNPELDRLLDEALVHARLADRLPLLAQVQTRMMEELPYFPLWYWNTTLITNRRVAPVDPQTLSASGALDPLSQLKIVNP